MFVKIFAKRCNSNIIDFKLFLLYIQDSEKLSERYIVYTRSLKWFLSPRLVSYQTCKICKALKVES